ncbi:MAG: hypothetical protein KJ645_03740, partial [Planctomycetes bacterium]|nr:hypothetical protein [Planctomycetota bacterium]
YIDVENQRVKGFDLLLHAQILSEVLFRLSPHDRSGVLDFGQISKDHGATGTIEIVNPNPKVPYTVTKMQRLCRQADFVEVSSETLEDGMHYRITLKILPGLEIPYLQGTIVLFSDHPDLPRKAIKFMGRVDQD